MLSADLVNRLMVEEKISNDAAAQRVTRAKEIKKIKGFFKSRQSFCYLDSQQQEGVVYDKFQQALYHHGKKYWYCLNAIRMHGGIVSRRYLECYTKYPVEPLASHRPFKEVMQDFVSESILIFNDDQYLFNPNFAQITSTSLIQRTLDTIKDSILEDFHSLVRNTGMISYNTGELVAEFGKFRWGFKGVSYVDGLKSNGKPGFILADVLFGVNVHKDDIAFFIEKLNYIKSFKNASRILPYLIVDDLDKEALEELKHHGIVIGFIKELFGETYGETLKELSNVLNNIGAALRSSPGKFPELLEALKTYASTIFYNIRGTLLELLVGHIHSKSCQSLVLGREIVEDGARHEMDVFAIYSDKVVIAECKAMNTQVNEEMINKWIRIKIPAFRKWLNKQETFRNHKIHFEYWATGGFTEEAAGTLGEYKKQTSKFNVEYFDGEEMRRKVVAMGDKKLKESLDKYFLKNKV